MLIHDYHTLELIHYLRLNDTLGIGITLGFYCSSQHNSHCVLYFPLDSILPFPLKKSTLYS